MTIFTNVRRLVAILGTAVVLLSVVLITADKSAATVYSCSPGYWKNHTDAWGPTGYSTLQTVGSVFDLTGYPAEIANATLLEALSFKGGNGVDGAARILLRAAVASLLNSAHPDLGWAGDPSMPSPAGVISLTNAALATGNRGAILMLAAGWDRANNDNLACPLE